MKIVAFCFCVLEALAHLTRISTLSKIIARAYGRFVNFLCFFVKNVVKKMY